MRVLRHVGIPIYINIPRVNVYRLAVEYYSRARLYVRVFIVCERGAPRRVDNPESYRSENFPLSVHTLVSFFPSLFSEGESIHTHTGVGSRTDRTYLNGSN